MNGKNQNVQQVKKVNRPITKIDCFKTKAKKIKDLQFDSDSSSDEETQIKEVLEAIKDSNQQSSKSLVQNTSQSDRLFSGKLPYSIFLFAKQGVTISNHCKIWIDVGYTIDIRYEEPDSLRARIEKHLSTFDWQSTKRGVLDLLVEDAVDLGERSLSDSGYLYLTAKEYLTESKAKLEDKPPVSYGRFYFRNASFWTPGVRGQSDSTTLYQDAEQHLEAFLSRCQKLQILDQNLQQQYQQLKQLPFLKRIFLYSATKDIRQSTSFDLQ